MTASSNVLRASLAAALLAAGLLVLVAAANPAGAAFPGKNGKIAFATVTVNSTGTGSNYDIWRMSANGTNQQPLTSSSGNDTDPTYSPNGKSIAFLSNRDGNTDVWLMDATGGSQRRLIANPMKDEYAPSWSPDGKKIAFVSNVDPSGNGNNVDLEVYVYQRGIGEIKQLTDNTVDENHPAWAPGGRKIAFVSSRDGDDEIFTMKPDGTRQRKLTNNTSVDDYEPDWSPGGTKIAFTSDRDNFDGEVYTMNSDGTAQRTLTFTQASGQPAWSPDGTKLAFFSARDNENSNIYRMTSTGGLQTPLTMTAFSDNDPTWQPLP
jgi:Tol biopolymer transport system component